MYIIHTCPARKWYVDRYLIPSMKKQGISRDKILVYNDANNDGQLTAFLKSYKLVEGKDFWHLQDDIIISSKFREITEAHNKGIVCGFCNEFSHGYPGYSNIFNMWYSMPCIRIPSDIFKGFISWMNDESVRKKYRAYFDENKHDDVFLEMYLTQNFPTLRVWNLAPNIVNHIDHLIGGSLINQGRNKSTEFIMSKYWNEPELLNDIERRLKERRKRYETYRRNNCNG